MLQPSASRTSPHSLQSAEARTRRPPAIAAFRRKWDGAARRHPASAAARLVVLGSCIPLQRPFVPPPNSPALSGSRRGNSLMTRFTIMAGAAATAALAAPGAAQYYQQQGYQQQYPQYQQQYPQYQQQYQQYPQ